MTGRKKSEIALKTLPYEGVMQKLKSRLKNAYGNVELYASKTWTGTSQSYHRANQVLYAREMKVREVLNEEPTRPRTVQDSIPESKLAQYANYEYNESRELSYAAHASNDILFYYPCMYPCRGTRKEPWMLPEIEQLFIWLVYSADFALLDLLAADEMSDFDLEMICDWVDSLSHEFVATRPRFYSLVERTSRVKKSRRVNDAPEMTDDDMIKFAPDLLKWDTFEDIVQRLKLKSDNMKRLWSQKPAADKRNSSKENIHNDEPAVCMPYNEKPLYTHSKWLLQTHSSDLRIVQSLADSIEALQAILTNLTVDKNFCSDFPLRNYVEADSPKVPTRRLYSAVLQGHATSKDLIAAVTSTTSTSVADPCFELIHFPACSPTATYVTTETATPIGSLHQKPVTCPPLLDVAANAQCVAGARASFAHTPDPPVRCCSSTTDLPIHGHQPMNAHYVHNSFVINQPYVDNSLNFNVQQQQQQQQTYPINYCRQYLWPVQQGKPPASPFPPIAHCSTNQHQACFVPARQPVPKWTPPGYFLRQPPPVQPHYATGNPRWTLNATCSFRSSSSQQIGRSTRFLTDYGGQPTTMRIVEKQPKKIAQPASNGKTTSEVGFLFVAGQERLSPPPPQPQPPPTPPPPLYRLKTAASTSSLGIGGQRARLRDPRALYDGDDNPHDDEPLLPVSSSASEELELAALEQYAASNENFYHELERQAEEQYEAHSENSISPPIELEHLGGSLLVHLDAVTRTMLVC